jgi:hypothetical protein
MQSVKTPIKTIPLENATRARLRFQHGAGQLTVRSGSDPTQLLGGDLGEHAELAVRREGEQVDVVLRPVANQWPAWIDPTYWWGPRRPFDWDVQLNPNVQLALELETGASRSSLDLSQLKVTEVILKTGMSATEVTLPAAAGFTAVEIHAGLAEVDLRIPPGVAATIRGHLGLAALNVDRARFPRTLDGYESPDFATATNRIQLRVEGGLGTVNVT